MEDDSLDDRSAPSLARADGLRWIALFIIVIALVAIGCFATGRPVWGTVLMLVDLTIGILVHRTLRG